MRVAICLFLLALQMVYVQYKLSDIQHQIKQLQEVINADGN